ncbi:Protein FAR1-RELATED SEQUENCE 5 [Hordeum vulgare]|nr:Protein FAR1-RELATED SEQUENCE 5 [Hordeum vulgare]
MQANMIQMMEVSSQPLPPYVGMVFDTVDDARKFYNDYAFKLGSGTHISTSKFTQKRGQKKEDANLIKRVFGCVHAIKLVKTETSSTSESIATRNSNSSRQPCEATTLSAKLLRTTPAVSLILDDAIKALEPAITAAKRGAMPVQQAVQQSEPPTLPAAATVPLNGDMPQHQSSDMLQNPARVPKKGRPTDREKRKKTLVEQRDDEQKKKMKNQEKKATTSGKTTTPKRTVCCKHCNELGHNIQTCGTLKGAMEAATAPQKCQFCSAVGHALPECQYLRVVIANDQRVAQMTQLNL